MGRTLSDSSEPEDKGEAAEQVADLLRLLAERDRTIEECRAEVADSSLRHQEALAAAEQALREQQEQNAVEMQQRLDDEAAHGLQARMEADMQAKIKALEHQHEQNVAAMAARHEAQLKELRDDYARKLGELDVSQKTIAEESIKQVRWPPRAHVLLLASDHACRGGQACASVAHTPRFVLDHPGNK